MLRVSFLSLFALVSIAAASRHPIINIPERIDGIIIFHKILRSFKI